MDLTNFSNDLSGINNLILRLEDQSADVTEDNKSEILAQIHLLIDKFLTGQKKSSLSIKDHSTLENCWLKLTIFQKKWEQKANSEATRKATQVAIERLESFINASQAFSLEEKNHKLLTYVITLAPLTLEDENQETALEYCYQLLKLYAPSYPVGDLFESTVEALSHYLEICSLENRSLARFHLLCLKIYKHSHYIDNLYNTYQDLENLSKDTTLSSYVRIKQAELISIDLTFDHKNKQIELLTNKQRQLLLSLTLNCNEDNIKVKANHMLGMSFMYTKCLKLRNAFMAKKAFTTLLQISKDPFYKSLAHYHLGFLHFFGCGKKFSIDTYQALDHFKNVVENVHNQNLLNKSAKIINLIINPFTYNFEIKSDSIQADRENLIDCLNVYLEGDPVEMAYYYAEFSARHFDKSFSPLITNSAVHIEPTNLLSFHHVDASSLGKNATPYKLHTQYVQKLFKKHYEEEYPKELKLWEKRAVNENIPLQSEGFAFSPLKDVGKDSRRFFSEVGRKILVPDDVIYGNYQKNYEIQSPNINHIHEMISDLINLNKSNSKPLTAYSEINKLMFDLTVNRTLNTDPNDKKKVQQSIVEGINYNKMKLSNCLRFKLCPLETIDSLYDQYQYVDFVPEKLMPIFDLEMARLIFSSYKMEKDFFKIDSKDRIMKALMRFEVAITYTKDFNQKLIILDEIIDLFSDEDIENVFLNHKLDDFRHQLVYIKSIIQIIEHCKFRGFSERAIRLIDFLEKIKLPHHLYREIKNSLQKPVVQKNTPKECYLSSQEDFILSLSPASPGFLCGSFAIAHKKPYALLEKARPSEINTQESFFQQKIDNVKALPQEMQKLSKKQKVLSKEPPVLSTTSLSAQTLETLNSSLPQDTICEKPQSCSTQKPQQIAIKALQQEEFPKDLEISLQKPSLHSLLTHSDQTQHSTIQQKESLAKHTDSKVSALQTSTKESKRAALEALHREERKQQLKKEKVPVKSLPTVNSLPNSDQFERSANNQQAVSISPRAKTIFDKIFCPHDSLMDLSSIRTWDACDFRTNIKLKREEVAYLIKELGGQYLPAEGKGSHAKCTLRTLNNSDAFKLKGESVYFANFDLLENLTDRAYQSEMFILTSNEYLKPYQVRQLCEKLIALGFTPRVVKKANC